MHSSAKRCTSRSRYTCHRCLKVFDYKKELTHDDFHFLIKHVRKCAKRFLNPEDIDEYYEIEDNLSDEDLKKSDLTRSAP